MDPILLIVVVVVVLAIAGAGWMFVRKRRTDQLAARFGPEYGRAVDEFGDRSRAEAELETRQKRVESLHLRPLGPGEGDAFARSWRSVQARFVDDPAGAVSAADQLVAEVMRARGYPVGDFEQRAADVSVDHPRVVDNYRAAHEIAQRSGRGQATTEDLRKSVVYYRALFEDLLETRGAEHLEVSR